ncbi:MAG: hypothetical protein ACOH5I_10990 [Oligoflexus sp.]
MNSHESLRYAFFQINEIGKKGAKKNNDGFLFASKHPAIINGQDYFINSGENLIKNPKLDRKIYGITTLGDSGGPVLNESLEVVGVIVGNVPVFYKGFELWNLFSSIDPIAINEQIKRPIVDFLPSEANKDEVFVAIGYRLTDLVLKAKNGEHATQTSCEGFSKSSLLDSYGLIEGTDYLCYLSTSKNKQLSFYYGEEEYDESIYIKSDSPPYTCFGNAIFTSEIYALQDLPFYHRFPSDGIDINEAKLICEENLREQAQEEFLDKLEWKGYVGHCCGTITKMYFNFTGPEPISSINDLCTYDAIPGSGQVGCSGPDRIEEFKYYTTWDLDQFICELDI